MKNDFHIVEKELFGTEKLQNKDDLHRMHDVNVNLSAGISAGAVALAANQMGMRTGFCACYDKDAVAHYLASIGHNLDGAKICVMLGIGYPNTEYASNVIVKDAENKDDEKILQRVTQHPKSVQYKIL